jgi:hypothetical protein
MEVTFIGEIILMGNTDKNQDKEESLAHGDGR